MDIKTLKSFISVAEHQSFSAAAKQLHTVQPAISRHIAQLEESLGVSLFNRNSREVIITSAGKQLLIDGHAILEQIEAASLRVKRAEQGEIGRLRVAHMPSACLPFMAKLINRYTNNYPGVNISLYEMAVTQQLEAFKNKQIDIGFSRAMPTALSHDYSSHTIYNDQLVVVVNQKHTLANRQSVTLEELQSEAVILFNRDEAVDLFDDIIAMFKKAGFSPNIVSQPRHMQTLLTEVAAGLGIAIAPYCIRKQYSAGCHFLTIDGLNKIIPTQLHVNKSNQAATVAPFVELTIAMKQEIEQSMSE